jgi:hypothetical protein
MEIGYESVDCIHLAQNRVYWLDLVKTIMNFWLP